MTLTIDETGNPIKVTGTTSTAQTVTTTLIRIKSILWHQPTTAGHKLALQQVGDSTNITEMYCDNANNSQYQEFNPPQPASGVSCNDMDSGTVYIYRV